MFHEIGNMPMDANIYEVGFSSMLLVWNIGGLIIAVVKPVLFVFGVINLMD